MGLWLGLVIRFRVRAIVSVRVRVSVNVFNFHIYFGVCGSCIWKAAGAFFWQTLLFWLV